MNNGKKVAYQVLCRQYRPQTELENSRECHHAGLSPIVKNVSSNCALQSTKQKKNNSGAFLETNVY